jgi:hypothetical protein
MSRSPTPVDTSSSQDEVQAPSISINSGVRMHRILCDANIPNPPKPISLVERTQLSYFQFNTPYSRDQYVTIFNQFYLLVGRVPITSQDMDHESDFLAILVHQGDVIEETILLPVPATFFQEPFYPEEPTRLVLSTPSPALAPPPPAFLLPPPVHVFPPPPLPPHITAQLGIVPIPARRTCWSQFKAMVIAHRMRIICYLMIIIIFTIFIIAIIH